MKPLPPSGEIDTTIAFTLTPRMDLPSFQSFVQQHAELFAGVHPESLEDLDAAERALGLTLPDTMRWLLREWGYSDVCGIDGLEGSVRDTLTCRQDIRLPHRYLVLNDWDDGGIVYLDSTTGRVSHDLGAGLPPEDDGETYENFAAWVASRVQIELDSLPETPEAI